MSVWSPGDAWPSPTSGGAVSPNWGGYVRLWVRAAIAAGNPFHMGTHPQDRLDGGNVLSGGEIATARGPSTGRLWVDLSCDIIDVEIQGGSSSAQGIFSKADACTLSATIADPAGDYDPLNRTSPFAYGGRSRLVPGVPVEAFVEVVDGDTGDWQRITIFTGTADSWGEEWTPTASNRQAKLIATDETKRWARYNRLEQAAQGAGDTVQQRIDRIVTFFDWAGEVEHPAGGSSRTLQATTLAQPGWELLNRATDDELGVVYFTADGKLRWLNRETWGTYNPTRLTLGCDSLDADAYDVLVEAHPANLDAQLRNDVRASRAGGSERHAFSLSSQDSYGAYEFKRTDLGLNDDAQVGDWATKVVELYAFPQIGLADVTMLPAVAESSSELWATVLDWVLYTDILRVLWAPPGLPDNVVDALVRVVGYSHRVSFARWEVAWQLTAARPISYAGVVFHMGPHAQDKLDTAFVMG